uniref:C3H1-type domain-containing protein n=1 Tax=Quercus lobata TaxID=97700 RepID=A0A7N2N7J6_QUELO
MNEHLTKKFHKEKIVQAIHIMHPTKASGPDGIAIFYQKVLCKFFAHCEFSHDWKDPPHNICTYYQKGLCACGSRCRYEHVNASRGHSSASSSSTNARQMHVKVPESVGPLIASTSILGMETAHLGVVDFISKTKPVVINWACLVIGIPLLVFKTYILLLFLTLRGTNNLQLPAPQDVFACNSDICISYPILARLYPKHQCNPIVTKDVMHAYQDGRLEEVVLRHLGSEDGETVIAKNIRFYLISNDMEKPCATSIAEFFSNASVALQLFLSYDAIEIFICFSKICICLLEGTRTWSVGHAILFIKEHLLSKISNDMEKSCATSIAEFFSNASVALRLFLRFSCWRGPEHGVLGMIYYLSRCIFRQSDKNRHAFDGIDVKGDPFWAEVEATLLVVSRALYAGLEFGLHFC